MKETDSIKITTEKYRSKNGFDYIKVTFWGRNKFERYPKIASLNIPADDIPEIISELQKAVQSDRSETTQNAEGNWNGPKNLNAEDLKEKIKVYIRLEKGIREDVRGFEAAYSECEKSLRELQNLRCHFKKLKEYYEKLEKIEDMYNLKIRDFMPIFNAVKEDWACFAGCVSEDLYESLLASIFNKKMHMSHFVSKNEKLLDKMGDIPDFPQFETPLSSEDEAGAGECKWPEKYYEYVGKIDNLREYLGNPEEIGGLSFDELSAICDKWEPCTEEIRLMRTYFLSGKDECIRKKDEYEEKCAKYKSEIKEYQQGSQTLASNIWAHEKEWYYYRLLQLACPLMKKVCSEEGEFNAEDAVSLCGQMWNLLGDFNKESKKYQFCWITHRDEACVKSQDISVDFVAGEADWPGLYLYSLNNPEKLICVTPGRIASV